MKEPQNPGLPTSDKEKFKPHNVQDSGSDQGLQERDIKDLPLGAAAELRNKAGKR